MLFNKFNGVAHLRREAGFPTQESFARAFDIPIGTVRNWEQDARNSKTIGMLLLRVVAFDGQQAAKVQAQSLLLRDDSLLTSDVIRNVRLSFGNISQDKFCARFGLKAKALRNWEQGTRTQLPAAAKTLFRIIDARPHLVEQALKTDFT